MESFERYAAHRPRKGDRVFYKGEEVGSVTRVDGALCWRTYPGGEDPSPFIWCFRDGVNAFHDWPSRKGAPIASCAGCQPEPARG